MHCQLFPKQPSPLYKIPTLLSWTDTELNLCRFLAITAVSDTGSLGTRTMLNTLPIWRIGTSLFLGKIHYKERDHFDTVCLALESSPPVPENDCCSVVSCCSLTFRQHEKRFTGTGLLRISRAATLKQKLHI